MGSESSFPHSAWYVRANAYAFPSANGTTRGATPPGDPSVEFLSQRQADVRLTVYNVLGQPVRVLFEGGQGAGAYSVQWDGRDALGRQVTSGMYLYRLEAGGDVAVRKMILAK